MKAIDRAVLALPRMAIVPRLGRWNSSSGKYFIFERIWWRGYRWTPLCRVERRRCGDN